MRYSLAILALLLASACVSVPYAHEADYVAAWCTDGKIEAELEDKTRVDCLTATHAIEFDYARKWAEAIGQSLHYARMTGRKAGIVLIVGQGDERHVRKVEALLGRLDITLWTVKR